MKFDIEEADRQVIILALAKLALTRPGWHPALLSRIAKDLGGEAVYNQFRVHGPDRSPKSTLEAIAAAIANARAGRHGGCPPILNVLEVLPPELREDVMEDAGAVLAALLKL